MVIAGLSTCSLSNRSVIIGNFWLDLLLFVLAAVIQLLLVEQSEGIRLWQCLLLLLYLVLFDELLVLLPTGDWLEVAGDGVMNKQAAVDKTWDHDILDGLHGVVLLPELGQLLPLGLELLLHLLVLLQLGLNSPGLSLFGISGLLDLLLGPSPLGSRRQEAVRDSLAHYISWRYGL